MFDLEHEIARWRRQFASGLLSAESLDELEGHLREEFERQRLAGENEPHAFAQAQLRLGDVTALQREFAKGDERTWQGVRQTLRRISTGFVHSRDLKVVTITGAALGLFGTVTSSYFLVRGWGSRFDIRTDLLMPYLLRTLSYVFMHALAVRAAWRYSRSHRMIDARGVVAYNVIIGWSIVINALNAFGFRQTPFYQEPVSRLLFHVVTLSIATVAWWFWMRRLARISTASPRPRSDSSDSDFPQTT